MGLIPTCMDSEAVKIKAMLSYRTHGTVSGFEGSEESVKLNNVL